MTLFFHPSPQAGNASDHLEASEAMSDNAAKLLMATGVWAQAKRKGDVAPDVTLPDAMGRPIRLSDAWRQGPLIVLFYRGGWCNYCNLQLRDWQQHSGIMRLLDVSLLAISPQTESNSKSTAENNGIDFPVLSDSSLTAANGFNIAVTLPPELIDFYAANGTDIPVLNGNGQWVLPIPATYLIDRSGTIQFAHIETDFRQRADPKEIIAIAEEISRRA